MEGGGNCGGYCAKPEGVCMGLPEKNCQGSSVVEVYEGFEVCLTPFV